MRTMLPLTFLLYIFSLFENIICVHNTFQGASGVWTNIISIFAFLSTMTGTMP